MKYDRRIRFVKQYTVNSCGNVFWRFERKDTGRVTDVRVRDGWKGWLKYDHEEARGIAAEQLGLEPQPAA